MQSAKGHPWSERFSSAAIRGRTRVWALNECDELFANNRRWAHRLESEQPGFFTELLAQQTPQYLWVGCADSRVPANELVGLLPGELFVHRNVANLMVHSDLNALSVLQYAVDVLKVRHVIVVGHSQCGGVRAAMGNERSGLVDNWLRHVQDVRDAHEGFLASLHQSLKVDALVELNVLEQARNICRTTVAQDAWRRTQEVVVHGWVYGLHNGLLEDLRFTVGTPEEVNTTYDAALVQVKRRWWQRNADLA
jgi:carbonic anhydrase